MTEQEWRLIFSERLKRYMKLRNMNQKNLSIKSGLTECAISRYCKGARVPNGDNIVRLAKSLNCTTDDLIMVDEMIDISK